MPLSPCRFSVWMHTFHNSREQMTAWYFTRTHPSFPLVYRRIYRLCRIHIYVPVELPRALRSVCKYRGIHRHHRDGISVDLFCVRLSSLFLLPTKSRQMCLYRLYVCSAVSRASLLFLLLFSVRGFCFPSPFQVKAFAKSAVGGTSCYFIDVASQQKIAASYMLDKSLKTFTVLFPNGVEHSFSLASVSRKENHFLLFLFFLFLGVFRGFVLRSLFGRISLDRPLSLPRI